LAEIEVDWKECSVRLKVIQCSVWQVKIQPVEGSTGLKVSQQRVQSQLLESSTIARLKVKLG